MTSQPNNAPPKLQRRPPGFTAPAAILCLLALSFPSAVTPSASGASKEVCLRLTERGAEGERAPLSLLQECSALYPEDVELLTDLGAAYEGTDPARAEAAYRRALELDPDYADVRSRLADLLLRRGAAREARVQAEAALRVQPNRRVLVELRARALAATAQVQ